MLGRAGWSDFSPILIYICLISPRIWSLGSPSLAGPSWRELSSFQIVLQTERRAGTNRGITEQSDGMKNCSTVSHWERERPEAGRDPSHGSSQA